VLNAFFKRKTSSSPEPAHYSMQRMEMVDLQLRSRGISNKRVLAAFSNVPRHEFTGERYRNQAYKDHPLPIGEGQTISQPYIVALMLESLAIQPSDRVLEVGTGSGYATALLAELAVEVVSIERHAILADQARELLRRLGCTNARVIAGDGSIGFPAKAPYNAILVSAAAHDVPEALITQLAEGGRMIIPVGPEDSQQLQLIKIVNGQPQVTARELCRFVPLIAGTP
jgi:protein-L-isoaspartate(D-aspartate) O-methyltransferase